RRAGGDVVIGAAAAGGRIRRGDRAAELVSVGAGGVDRWSQAACGVRPGWAGLDADGSIAAAEEWARLCARVDARLLQRDRRARRLPRGRAAADAVGDGGGRGGAGAEAGAV